MAEKSTKKQKSPLNKTLDISVEEGLEFFSRVLQCQNPQNLEKFRQDLEKDSKFAQNRTILGDTFEILPLIPHNSVDLVVADPPYNLSKTYAGWKFTQKSRREYYDWTLKWVQMALPSLKDQGSMYICCDWKSRMVIADVLMALEEEKKLVIQNRITWQREKGRGAKENWKNSMEDIWFVTKTDQYKFNLDAVKQRRKVVAPYRVDGKPKDWKETDSGGYRDTCPGNFWDDISIPFWSMAENTAHPTQKPEKLLAKLILASSDKGDLVLDPFLGSGTTSVVASKLGRRYIGIEKSDQYATWAEKRLEDARVDREIQGFWDGVFWERNSHP